MDNFKPISQPMEMPRSADYRVTVGGVPVAVIEVPRPQERIAEGKRFEYAYAAFEADAETIVEVEAIADDLQMSDPCVLPDSLGAKCERLSPSKARFALKAPCTAVFEANGRHRALVIAAMKPSADAPAEGDPKVIFVGPGLHHRDLTVVGEGETLYLAPGAVLEGAVLVEGDDARVCGHGIVSGVPWPWQNGPKVEGKANFSGHMMLVKGKRVEVRDIALLSSWGWTLVVSDTEDTRIDGVKILGGRVINDDGIDICKSRRTTIRNCFVRCQDDCIAPKWWYEDLTVESCTLWTDVANIFRVGYECSEAPTRSRGIVFRDIDILHTTLEASETTSYWANCLICIQASNGHVIEDVLFDDIRIHEIGRWDIFLLVKTMPISVFFDFPESGTIRGITFRDIHLPAGEFKAPIRLESHDPEHTVSGIRFDGVDGYGKVEIVGEVADVIGTRQALSESFEGFLSQEQTIIARDCHLAYLTVCGARLNGSWVPSRPEARVERIAHSGTKMDFQLQAIEGGHLKCVHVILSQDGPNVMAQADWVACATPEHGYGCDLSQEGNREHYDGLTLATGTAWNEAKGEGPWNGYGVDKLVFRRSPMLEVMINAHNERSDCTFVRVRVRPMMEVPSGGIRVGLHLVKDDKSWGGVVVDKLPRDMGDGWFQVDYTLAEAAQGVLNARDRGLLCENEYPWGFSSVVFFSPDGTFDNASFKTELGFALAQRQLVRLDDSELEDLKTAVDALKSGYRVAMKLGRGAMGEVWEVEDVNLHGPHMAMKVFNPRNAKNRKELQARFDREARVLHEISHDVMRSSIRLPRIHRYVINSQGTQFYVMDLVVGPKGKPCNLWDMRKEEYNDLFDEEHMAEWFEDVCRELSVLHRHHCLHRDIKPENILVDEDGHAVIVDFGTANVIAGHFADDQCNDITIVGTDSIEQVGTPAYWAPELFRGKSASEASDIYALAATFWKMLFNETYEEDDHSPEREKFADWEDGDKWFTVLTKMLSHKPADRPSSVDKCLELFKGNQLVG